ncbi:MAG: mRNA surveillance protein pelota [Candidatus Aenigmarchaeota archaeon]|nr:mRNA surveillance protein pelota [Candidatus Aenigmarchaeota archaeon]
MKILKMNLKDGVVSLRVDDDTDLWHLQNVLNKGDRVKATTLRNLFIYREGKKVKIGKKPMKLLIEVENVEYHKYSNKLRITGKIVEGPDDVQIGSYHTIEIKPHDSLTIIKEWKKYELDRIKKAEKSVPPALIVVVDHHHATFASVKESGVEVVSEVSNPHSLHDEKQEEFYKRVATEIKKLSENFKVVILAGPGNVKDYVFNILKESSPGIKDKIFLEFSSSSTKSGIMEVLKRGVLKKVMKESRVQQEIELVERFFEHLAKDDGLVVYGLDEVKKATDMGAVSMVLVSEDKIKSKEVEEVCKRVEGLGGKVEIISTSHENGERFSRLGGIGAFLRYRIS